MQLHYTIWQKTRDGLVEPMEAWSPAGITSSELAREDARALVLKHHIPAVSLTIVSEDGALVEEWRWRRNKWIEASTGAR